MIWQKVTSVLLKSKIEAEFMDFSAQIHPIWTFKGSKKLGNDGLCKDEHMFSQLEKHECTIVKFPFYEI